MEENRKAILGVLNQIKKMLVEDDEIDGNRPVLKDKLKGVSPDDGEARIKIVEEFYENDVMINTRLKHSKQSYDRYRVILNRLMKEVFYEPRIIKR